MNSRLLIFSAFIWLAAVCPNTFAQGVIFTGTNAMTTNVVEIPSPYPAIASNEVSSNLPPLEPKVHGIPPSQLELPGITPPAQSPSGNPSVSGLRTAIFALAAVVILPCLFCAAVMIAKENRRAARVCVIAALIFGAACLLALVVVDSFG